MSPQELVAHIQKEWSVLRTTPFTFITLCVLTAGCGFGAAKLLDAGQISSLREQNNAKEGQVSRYRVALGIDPASKGALVELSNEELVAKAQSTVRKIREFAAASDLKFASLKTLQDQVKNESASQKAKDMSDALTQISQDFDQTLASDAYNVDDEVRKRLDARAIVYVVQVPRIKTGDGTGISILSLTRGMGLDVFYARKLADEIEQMTNLLPTSTPSQSAKQELH